LTPYGINCYLHSINWFSTKEIPKVTTDPTADPGPRAALIAGLLDLACFLESHPDVPVSDLSAGNTLVWFPDHGADDDEQRAAVDAAASALGVKAEDPRRSGHYGAERAFGPVVYRVVMLSSAATARYDAENSYRDSIRLDEPERPALVSAACEHCDGTGYCVRPGCETCKHWREATGVSECGACCAPAVRLVGKSAA
jgi:hypothetical protein